MHVALSALRRAVALTVVVVVACVALTGHLVRGVQVGDDDTKQQQSCVLAPHAIQSNSTTNTPTQALQDVILRSLPPAFVLLTTSESSEHRDSVSPSRNESELAVAAVLSPRFLLTLAEWLPETSVPSHARSARASVAIKRIWFERDFVSSPESANFVPSTQSSSASASPFAVVELERDSSFSAALSRSPLVLENASTTSSLQVVFTDSVVLATANASQTTFPAAAQPSSVCSDSGSETISADDVLCVQSERPSTVVSSTFTNSSSSSSSRAPDLTKAFVTASGAVVGAASSTHGVNSSHVVQSFVLLGSPPHRAFLDLATRGSFAWCDDKSTAGSATTVAPSPAPPPKASALHEPQSSSDQLDRVVFYDNNTRLACGGIQIARDYILTSASCVLAHNVTSVSIRGRTAQIVAQQDIHPRFTQSNRSELDVAMLYAPSAANSVPRLVLNPLRVLAFQMLDRTCLGGRSQRAEPVQVLPAALCSLPQARRGGNASAVESQCIGPLHESTTLESTSDGTNAALGQPVVTAGSSTYYLAGLQADTTHSRRFVAVSNIVNFINAFADGHVWGTTAHASTNGQPSSLPVRGATPPPMPTTTLKAQPTAVGLRAKKDGKVFCSGTLIAPAHVLTTANCVSDGLVSWVSIGTEVIRVAAGGVAVHPSFGQPFMTSFNAAVLEFEYPAMVPPVPLSDLADFPDATAATMTSASSAVTVPVWPKRTCEAMLPSVDDSVLCAGGEAGVDACTGDAGSPLTIRSPEDGKDVLIGLVNAGYGCGQPGLPGIYTRIASLAALIRPRAIGVKWQRTSVSAPASTLSNELGVPPQSINNATTPMTASGGAITSSTPTPATPSPDASEASSTEDSRMLPRLRAVTRAKVLDFLLGTSVAATSNVRAEELRRQLARSETTMTLYSTGDLSSLFAAIATHNARALNERTDRFGSVARDEDDSTRVGAKRLCST